MSAIGFFVKSAAFKLPRKCCQSSSARMCVIHEMGGRAPASAARVSKRRSARSFMWEQIARFRVTGDSGIGDSSEETEPRRVLAKAPYSRVIFSRRNCRAEALIGVVRLTVIRMGSVPVRLISVVSALAVMSPESA